LAVRNKILRLLVIVSTCIPLAVPQDVFQAQLQEEIGTVAAGVLDLLAIIAVGHIVIIAVVVNVYL
jgi:hypothetical protein